MLIKNDKNEEKILFFFHIRFTKKVKLEVGDIILTPKACFIKDVFCDFYQKTLQIHSRLR